MSGAPLPPRFVPTLTEIVQSGQAHDVSLEKAQPASFSRAEDQMVHRVMQRVDLVLERKLREAVAQVILSHTQNLAPRLREQIELVVRESVSDALALELPPSVRD